jgi:predicted amidohydrolase
MIAACEAQPGIVLCTSLVLPVGEGFGVVSVLVDKTGIFTEQPQLHRSRRYPWMVPGDTLELTDLPWGRVAMITGDDMVYPELVKVAALRGAHVLLAPLQIQETWEEVFGLRSRAAENRVCIVASSRPLGAHAGLIADLEQEFTLMTEWRERKFDGYINAPLVTEQRPGDAITIAAIHPAAACDKLMSEKTDLLLDRPWRLCGDLVKTPEDLDVA